MECQGIALFSSSSSGLDYDFRRRFCAAMHSEDVRSVESLNTMFVDLERALVSARLDRTSVGCGSMGKRAVLAKGDW